MPIGHRRETGLSSGSVLQSSQALLCSVALVACALIARPFVELGINDEFTYIRSALHLAQTGQIAYFGWGSPILGWQLYLGALFIKLFGFSFSAVRFSVLVVAAATVYLLHRTLVRCGISETNATIGTLTFSLSPLFLPLAFSFMTDVPGIFSLLLCLYCCLRASQSPADSAAFRWIILAAVSNVLTGTVRQTSWLGVIVLVPSTLWLLRTRIPWVKGALLWLGSMLCIFACLKWFGQQPYIERVSLIDNLREGTFKVGIVSVCHFLMAIPSLVLPVMVAFIVPAWVKTRKSWLAVYIAATLLTATALAGSSLHLHHLRISWLAPWGMNYVTPRGLIDIPDIGIRPTVMGPVVRLIITFVALIATFACVACISHSPGTYESGTSLKSRNPTGRDLAFLLAPVTIAYFALLLPRAAINQMFDRYEVPLLFVALIFVLRLYQRKVAARLPAISFIVLFIVAAYSVAAMHDLFAMERARLAAADELRAAGVPRTAFYGGVEYDGWTQIDSWGYVKSQHVTLPPGRHPTPSWNLTSNPCGYFFAPQFIAIQPQYALSFDPSSCDGPSRFAPVPYRTWLPPYSSAIYVQSVSLGLQ